MKKVSFVVCVAYLVSMLILFLAIPGFAKHLEWQAPTQYADGTPIEGAVLAKMKYYVRTKAPNKISTTPDGTGWYYLGETASDGTTFWPPDNLLEAGMNPGDSMTYTVTANYKDGNGVWHESALSSEVTLSIPFPEGKVPASPGGVTIQD